MFDIQGLILSAPAILFGLTIHEFSHGWAAWKLGDPTAKMMGRLTLNPIKHLDPIGTIALFLFRFGWAKPVPIDPRNFRHPTRDMAISSLAGPAANLLTAGVSGIILRVLDLFHVGGFASILTGYFVLFNLILCFFNLIPIPPLDGSRLLYHLLPPNLAAAFGRLERYGFIILIGIIFLGQLTNVNLLWLYMSPLLKLFSLLFVGRQIV
ncbi:site-2 protease family protein [candidate division WOR-3 bacterium]|uniref:Site-2 protease family protein n=1 Tax=candidate division WOR-3 bacterium TaxID=2052148 RepID=A0A938BSD3_UNCW3|nr:site-2 protease family protein [candidate division WOR-3 bacterium]